MISNETHKKLVDAAVDFGFHSQHLRRLVSAGTVMADRDDQGRIWIPNTEKERYEQAKVTEKKPHTPPKRVYIPRRIVGARTIKSCLMEYISSGLLSREQADIMAEGLDIIEKVEVAKDAKRA